MLRDQADGLRRLLGKAGLRVLTLHAARRGVGKTSAAVNLATALARNGHEVLLLDENNDLGNAGEILGLRIRQEFVHAVRGECALEQAMQRCAGGFTLLPAARGLAEIADLTPVQRTQLGDAMTHACRGFDLVIVDAQPGMDSRSLPLSLPDQADVLVVPGGAAAITDAYALIKQLSGEFGKRRFRVLMSKLRDEVQARAIFSNMSAAARRYLSVELEFMGLVPSDERLKRASGFGQPVLTAFPDAAASAAYRRLGGEIVEWPRSRDASCDIAGFAHALLRCAGQRVAPAMRSAGAMSYPGTLTPTMAAPAAQWSC